MPGSRLGRRPVGAGAGGAPWTAGCPAEGACPAGGSFIANNAIGYIFMADTLAYATKGLGLSCDLMLLLILVAWSAALSDRFGRRSPT